MTDPDVDSIVELARRLIAIPSQGGIDRPDPVIDAVERWLADREIAPVRLRDGDGVVVGTCAEVGSGSGPRYCLNACLDTAPFKDPRHWTSSPTGGEVRDGWFTGRGAADCKTAVAIFAHLGAELAARAHDLAETFPVGPKATVTAITGGAGYSVVPDRCAVSVDVRLTPRFDDRWADELLRRLCHSLDEEMPSPLPTQIVPDSSWPAYRLPPASKLASALQEGARRSVGRDLSLTVAGPSNIGNYLASLGVEATCGFGVVYRNLHAADEAIEVASIAKVYEAYRVAVRQLLLAGGQT